VLPLLKLLAQTQPFMLRLLVQTQLPFGGEDSVIGNPRHHAKIPWCWGLKQGTDSPVMSRGKRFESARRFSLRIRILLSGNCTDNKLEIIR
jgi:hypothetical protein